MSEPDRSGGECPLYDDDHAPTVDPSVVRSATATAYSEYAAMDTLLSLQHPLTEEPTEAGFIILSQVKELLFKLLYIEFAAARGNLAADRLDEALWTLRRALRVQHVLLSCWDALAAMSPIREILGTASGFQSSSYRQLEFVLGNKNPSLAGPHRDTAKYAEVLADLQTPSLYDEAIRYLARRGVDIPAELIERDVTVPYEPSEQIEAAWPPRRRAPRRATPASGPCTTPSSSRRRPSTPPTRCDDAVTPSCDPETTRSTWTAIRSALRHWPQNVFSRM